jgi:hypothetical protein
MFNAIGSIIDSLFGSGSSSDTEQLQAQIDSDNKRDSTQWIAIGLTFALSVTALLVAIFKKK